MQESRKSTEQVSLWWNIETSCVTSSILCRSYSTDKDAKDATCWNEHFVQAFLLRRGKTRGARLPKMHVNTLSTSSTRTFRVQMMWYFLGFQIQIYGKCNENQEGDSCNVNPCTVRSVSILCIDMYAYVYVCTICICICMYLYVRGCIYVYVYVCVYNMYVMRFYVCCTYVWISYQ